MSTGFPHNGNEVMGWILQQKDCWLEEKGAFHIGKLQERWVEQNPNFKNLSKQNQSEAFRVIAVEARIAKHEVYSLREKGEW